MPSGTRESKVHQWEPTTHKEQKVLSKQIWLRSWRWLLGGRNICLTIRHKFLYQLFTTVWPTQATLNNIYNTFGSWLGKKYMHVYCVFLSLYKQENAAEIAASQIHSLHLSPRLGPKAGEKKYTAKLAKYLNFQCR